MDDLLDLDFTKPAPPTSGPSSQAGYGLGRSAFDYLAKSTSTGRAIPPSSSPLNGSALGSVRSYAQAKTSGAGAAPVEGTGGGAFSSLFGANTTSSAAAGPSLSMADRLAKERSSSPAFGLGGYHNSGALSAASRSSSPANSLPLRNGSSPSPSVSTPKFSPTPPLRSNAPSPASLSAAAQNTSTTSSQTSRAPDPWDFDLLSSTVPTPRSSTSSQSLLRPADPFDLGFDVSSPASATLPTSSATTISSSTSPATNVAADFDLLGAFSQPAIVSPTMNTSQPESRSIPPPPRTSSDRNPVGPQGLVSPPPELLLKLTQELGFPLPEANRALIQVYRQSGKFGLEDAVEFLMNDGPVPVVEEPAEKRKSSRSKDVDEWGEEDNVRIGRRRSWEFDDGDQGGPNEFERQRRQRQAADHAVKSSEGSANQRRTKENGGVGVSGSGGDMDQAAKVLQEQANEVLAQAQKIGFSMFKSANALLGAGKEALAKKLEEQRKAARLAAGLPGAAGAPLPNGDGKGPGLSNGRPKWWREGMDADHDQVESERKGKQRDPNLSGSGNRDNEAEQPISVLPRRPSAQQAPSPASDPAEYRSPFRRAKVMPTAISQQPVEADLLSGATSGPISVATPSAPTPRATRPTPPAPTSRQFVARRAVVAVSPSALSHALNHKSTGNSHFKLGRFADASQSYSIALEALPGNWIGRILLLNNRAQSRLKSGEEKLAIEDCSQAIKMLFEPYPQDSAGKYDISELQEESVGIGKEVEQLAGGSVDLREQLGKSLGRRAKGYEVIEKWNLGLRDWEQIRAFGDEVVVRGAGGNKLVGDGISRCRRMLDPVPPASSSTRPVPQATATSSARPKSRPAVVQKQADVSGTGAAVKAFQASQAAQLAEEDLRLQLKDQVDSRILSWKASKETNLRALIASLDQVLWPELGWKKVGMNELITENQLKIRYVRAIAKVHPDKLNVGNTSVEQRMIAGAVFGALNEAWNATKA